MSTNFSDSVSSCNIIDSSCSNFPIHRETIEFSDTQIGFKWKMNRSSSLRSHPAYLRKKIKTCWKFVAEIAYHESKP